MQMRCCSRVPVQCAIQFRGASLFGSGMIMDLSEHGAKVVSGKGIELGMNLTVQIHLLPHALPVKVEVAAVRWVNGGQFGLEFISMQDSERSRLRGLEQKA